MATIKIEHVTKRFGDNTVVCDFSAEIQDGSFVTFLGPSGCGKTTLLRMIGGFEIPTSGTILLNGEDIGSLPPNRRPINTVFQKYALFPYLNIYENIAFGLKLKKLPKDVISEKVEHVLKVVDLEGFEKRRIDTLSGGQQQRVAIARAIVNEPEILLLDEPLGALDHKMRQEMQLELMRMHEELGITFIYVTHDQEEALTMSNMIVVMDDGIIMQKGTPEDIYKRPENAYVADFIGASNIFTGYMTDAKVATFCDTAFPCDAEFDRGTKIDAMVRPENVSITEPGQGNLDGEVLQSVFKGTHYETAVSIGKYEMELRTAEELSKGQKVGLLVPPAAIHVMPYDMDKNHYTAELNEEGQVVFEDFTIPADFALLFPHCRKSGSALIGPDGKRISYQGRRVDISFDSADADLSDNPEEGLVQGVIANIIYKGDHYSYTVRSDNDWDYYVNDDYLWNQDDRVSVIVPPDKLKMKVM